MKTPVNGQLLPQYQVLKEGETKGGQRVIEGMGGTEVVTEDWWGIRFQGPLAPSFTAIG